MSKAVICPRGEFALWDPSSALDCLFVISEILLFSRSIRIGLFIVPNWLEQTARVQALMWAKYLPFPLAVMGRVMPFCEMEP